MVPSQSVKAGVKISLAAIYMGFNIYKRGITFQSVPDDVVPPMIVSAWLTGNSIWAGKQINQAPSGGYKNLPGRFASSTRTTTTTPDKIITGLVVDDGSLLALSSCSSTGGDSQHLLFRLSLGVSLKSPQRHPFSLFLCL